MYDSPSRDLWNLPANLWPYPHTLVLTCTECQGDTLKGWGLTPETFGWWRCGICQTTFVLAHSDNGIVLQPLTQRETTKLFRRLYGDAFNHEHTFNVDPVT